MDGKDPWHYIKTCLNANQWNLKCKFEYNMTCRPDRFGQWSCSERPDYPNCCYYVCP